jgi:hypothetical protein|tara:strand:+ start:15049 stop:16014 length:966 start_codon:yes stop_codon:yes gene_type:complete
MNLKDIVVLSESPEDEALLQKAEYARDQARATTKNIKYDDTAIEIISKVSVIADELNNEELKQELEYLEKAVFQAKNDVESAIYELEEPFNDLIRTLQYKIDDEESDRREAEYSEETFQRDNMEPFKSKDRFLENFDVVRNTKKVEVTTKSNTNNERKVAKLLRTVLVNEDSKLDVYELFSLLQSEKPELVEAFKSVALTTYDVQLDEGTGRIRAGLAAIALLLSLGWANNQLAQQSYDNSPQLQKLIVLHQQAEQTGNTEYTRELEQRIRNHKTRIDIGKGEVMGPDGRPKQVTETETVNNTETHKWAIQQTKTPWWNKS